MATKTPTKEPITLRLPPQLCAEVRSVASREGESLSTIYRRLVRRGLQREHDHDDNEAA